MSLESDCEVWGSPPKFTKLLQLTQLTQKDLNKKQRTQLKKSFSWKIPFLYLYLSSDYTFHIDHKNVDFFF